MGTWGMLALSERALVAGLIKANYSIAPALADVYTDDIKREPQGITPLIKVYPENSPGKLVGAHADSRHVEHHLTVSVRCRDQDHTYAAKVEVCRILDKFLDHPFVGYDLIDHDEGAYRGGSAYYFQWDIEVTLTQFRKPTNRS
jgi:hypothetical protein